MSSTLITAYVGQGLAANRPATPVLATGTIGYWYSTDTGLLSAYLNGAWSNVVGKTQIAATQSPSGVNNVTFSSIVAGFRDLELRIRGRASDAVSKEAVQLQFNADTGNNYDYQQENRFSRTNGNAVGFISPGFINAASSVANYATDLIIDIPDYTGTTFYKRIRCYQEVLESQADAGMYNNLSGGWWRNTAAITSIKIILASGNFVAGSTVSLYGIPA